MAKEKKEEKKEEIKEEIKEVYTKEEQEFAYSEGISFEKARKMLEDK